MDSTQSLGIDGLPAAVSALNSGALYLIASASSQLTQALLFANLPSASTAPLICVSTLQPAAPQDTAWLDRRLHANNLALLSPRPSRKPLSRKLMQCLGELAHQRSLLLPASGGMILALDHAENYLPLDHPAETRRILQDCSRWCTRHGHTLLLILDSLRLGPAGLPLLSQLGGDCAGLAYAQYIGHDSYSWQVSHWLGAQPSNASDIHTLALDAGGALHLPPEHAPQAMENPGQLADDYLQVLATNASLSGNPPPSPHWQLFDDLPQLLAAAHNAVAATVLLDTASEKREALSHAVDQLRQHCGKRLKIVVREVGNRRLRQNEEQLLLRLGANAVLPAELRFASVVSITLALRPALFSGKNKLERQQLHAASQPEADRGYLPPARFIEVVRNTVQRSRAIDVSSMLIQLRPAAGASPHELLALGRFQRAGDLCCADHEYAYLFLFACRDSDVDAALNNLFRLPVGEVAELEVRSPDSDSILLALTQMAAQPGFAKLPDLSPQLADSGEPPLIGKRQARQAAPALQRQPLTRRRAP